MNQIIFILLSIVAFGIFGTTIKKIFTYFKFTKKTNPIDNINERIRLTLLVAFGQSKILRKPFMGFFHAIIYWGFLVITFGSLEMIIDGISGKERIFKFLGPIYNFITASGDIFALLIIFSCIFYLIRRYIIKPHRFIAPEMKPGSRMDATFILSMILLLMLSLIGMNLGYIAYNSENYAGIYPVSKLMVPCISSLSTESILIFEKANWWLHISLIYLFLNVLPLSKHFHVILSIPNVFLSKLEPKTTINTMPEITKEVRLMLDPSSVIPDTIDETLQSGKIKRFGVKDVEDVTWKNYLDALTCTECGRCTSVCPANITGKKLSPRKLFIDVRARMKEKAPGLIKEGFAHNDGKSLLSNYISEEELWACTTCNACVEECPVNIDQPSLIIDMRRYLVMEESKAPTLLNTMFTNIENNGAPWAFPSADRMKWADGLNIATMAELSAKGESPDILFWVGCAGSFDDRYKKVTVSFAKILQNAKINFAILGLEESCTGDPAKRAGNEFLAQMMAINNINTLNNYKIKKIVTACPHCFNTLLNEYPALGGHYEVIHHSTLLEQLISQGKIIINTQNRFSNEKVTFHDSCYLGRGNNIYSSPRSVIDELKTDLIEMKNNKSKGLCCGAGGAQMFKEEEKGTKAVNVKRIEEALETGSKVVASACPFCLTMLCDGLKEKNEEEKVKVYDIAEMVFDSISPSIKE